jgi:hypothetical protein
MARSLLALVLVMGLAGTSAAAGKDAPAAGKDVPDAKGAPSGKDQKWFASPNPFAPLASPESPKEKPAAADEGTPRMESPRIPVPYVAAPAAPAAPSTAPAAPKLNGILFSARLIVAIVDDTLVKIDDEVGGLRIKSITVDTVLAEKEGTRYVMTTRRPNAQALPEAPAEKSAAAEPAKPAPGGETGLSLRPETADKNVKESSEKVAANAAPSKDAPSDAGEDK